MTVDDNSPTKPGKSTRLYDVVLIEVPPANRMRIMDAMLNNTYYPHLSLVDAMVLVFRLPSVVMHCCELKDATILEMIFEIHGATVQIRPAKYCGEERVKEEDGDTKELPDIDDRDKTRELPATEVEPALAENVTPETDAQPAPQLDAKQKQRQTKILKALELSTVKKSNPASDTTTTPPQDDLPNPSEEKPSTNILKTLDLDSIARERKSKAKPKTAEKKDVKSTTKKPPESTEKSKTTTSDVPSPEKKQGKRTTKVFKDLSQYDPETDDDTEEITPEPDTNAGKTEEKEEKRSTKIFEDLSNYDPDKDDPPESKTDKNSG